MSRFNPVYTIRKTMLETMKACGDKRSKKDQEAYLHEICHMVRLDPQVLSSYPHELSGGMKQRAAIGLAILFHPTLLILDEATTGLDLLIQAQVLGTILELRDKYEMTILFISHDRALSENFCDRQIEL
jgi:peptide/nickel transport system ATP-binding protein